MAKKKKRPLTAYQKHVKEELKAGRTMKKAAASWKRSPTKSTTRRRRKTAKKKKSGGRRGSRLLGNIGIKGMLTGGAMLFAAQSLLPAMGGEFAPAVQKIAAGLGAKTVGVGGASLMGAGAMEAGAILIRRFLGGGLALPSIGGGQGGYDY